MDKKYILSKTDHTLLAQGADFEQIKALCDDAIKYGTASVCIAPSFVKAAKKYVGNKMQICTVIGFPNGYNTTSVKCFETRDAVANGADEIESTSACSRKSDMTIFYRKSTRLRTHATAEF